MHPHPSNPAQNIPAPGCTRETIVCGAGDVRRGLLAAAGGALASTLAEFDLDELPIRGAQRAGVVVIVGDGGPLAGLAQRLTEAPLPSAVIALRASRVGSRFPFDRRLTWPELPLLAPILGAEATRPASQRLARAFARWTSLHAFLGRALWMAFVGSPVETVQGLARRTGASTRSLQAWWHQALDPNRLPLRDVVRTARLLRWLEASEIRPLPSGRPDESLPTLRRIAEEVLSLTDDLERLRSWQTEDAFIDRLNEALLAAP